jgi:alcohol dehydrogenase (cytochrome c)
MRFKLSALLVTAALASMAAQATVTDQMIENDAKTPGDILSWGIGTQGQRYSPLKQINASTINRLVPAWSFSFGGEKQRGQQTQPIIHKGKMYVTASYSRIFALDAKTGQKLWKYEHRLPEGIMPCCDVINRGAAIYDNLVIFGTLDAQLVALNADTGEVVWKEKIDNYADGYSYTAAPLIANGLVLTGVSGGEFGVVGRVEARDAKTGRMVWMRPVVEGHMGKKFDKDGKESDNGVSGTAGKTWPGDLWKTGGAATWLGGTYNAKTGLAYFGTGNPAPWNSHLRKGDNLYSCSTVAIDVKTGQIVWHYQNTPNDGWDFDGVNEFVTYDDGNQVLGGKADRNGFFYVNDAKTGKLVNAFPFVKKVTWATGIDLKTGRPNYVPENRPGDPTGAAEGKGKVVFSAPSFLGGKNQMPMAYSPDTKLFYVPANEWGMEIWNEPITYKKGAAYLGAGLHDQDPQRRAHRCPARHRSEDGQDRLGSAEQCAAVGRCADHRRQPGVLGHARGLPAGRRRQDRQGGVEVPDRLGRRRPAGDLGNGWRAVRGRRSAAGAAPCRCGAATWPRRSPSWSRAARCGSSSS